MQPRGEWECRLREWFDFEHYFSGGALDFLWNSLEGMEYDLVSTDDLEAEQDPSLWAPYNDDALTYEVIESTGSGIQTLTRVGIVAPKRFFTLIERPISKSPTVARRLR